MQYYQKCFLIPKLQANFKVPGRNHKNNVIVLFTIIEITEDQNGKSKSSLLKYLNIFIAWPQMQVMTMSETFFPYTIVFL